MTGHYVIGTVSTNVLFFALLVVGVGFRGLRAQGATVFVLLWLVGYVGLPYVSFGGRVFGAYLFVPYLALLDLVLMAVIFKALDDTVN